MVNCWLTVAASPRPTPSPTARAASGANPDTLRRSTTTRISTTRVPAPPPGAVGVPAVGATSRSGTTAADSWVDVKGNDWLVEGNTGTHTSKDGFQVHQVVDGWGTGNRFQGNVARTRGSGVDVYVQPGGPGNQVLCDNRDGAGGAASTNAPCA